MALAGMAIGGLSARTGVSVETIRYYERIGLLPKPARAENGRRVYDARAASRLAFIRRGRELGFPIENIRTLLSIADGEGTCADVYELTRRHLADIASQIADLRRMQAVLSHTAEQCTRDASRACPIIDALARG